MLAEGCCRRLSHLRRLGANLLGLTAISARLTGRTASSGGGGLWEGPLRVVQACNGRVAVALIAITARLQVRLLAVTSAMAAVSAPTVTHHGLSRLVLSVAFSRYAPTSQSGAAVGRDAVETAITGQLEVYAVIATEIAIAGLATFLAIGNFIGRSGKRRAGLRRRWGRRARWRARGQT